jgi:hypothetical protein
MRRRARRRSKALGASGQLGYGIPEKSLAAGLERVAEDARSAPDPGQGRPISHRARFRPGPRSRTRAGEHDVVVQWRWIR